MILEAEKEKRRRKREGIVLTAPDDWQEWLKTLFPKHFIHPFAKRHIEFWKWVEAIKPNKMPRPFIGIWGRGGAKSTNAEGAIIRLGSKKIRKYAWYVSSTQDKADQHVDNIGEMLTNSETNKYYPDLANRAVNKFGFAKGWRRERLRTASGFTIDSLGLDTGARGAKVDEQRPDLIVIDDVDELFDTTKTTMKKIQILSKTILPAGSMDCAVLFVQNLIHADSIASRLVDGRADFLMDRIISGPYPAIENLAVNQVGGKFKIVGGTPTWRGQSLAIAQQQINLWGYSAFMQEAQHGVDKTGGIWDHIDFQHVEFTKLPPFIRTAVWVDPAVTEKDESDSMGIAAGGLTRDRKIVGLYWWEAITSPEDALERAIKKAIEIHATHVGVETDQGGLAWKSVYLRALAKVQKEYFRKFAKEVYNQIVWPRFTEEKAASIKKEEDFGSDYKSKTARNFRMLTDYEHGMVSHMIGTHTTIEKALWRFPKTPLDVADAWYWCWNDLRNKKMVRAI